MMMPENCEKRSGRQDASQTQTPPPPLAERPINTSIITQTLRNTVLSNNPGPNAKSFAVSGGIAV